MSKKFTTYALVVVLILIAVFWVYRFLQGPEVAPGVVVTSTAGTVSLERGSEESVAVQQLSAVLKSMDGVTLAERSLLSNQIFRTELRDFGRPLADRPWGRSNPFAAPGLGATPVAAPDEAPDEAAVTDQRE